MKKQLAALFCTGVMTISLFAGAAFAEDTGSVEGIQASPEFYSPFKEVFKSIQEGRADFGIIPIENSSAGSVSEVYDLMLSYRFHIAAAVDISVDHCLAALPGADIREIKTVFSHEQALMQCSDFMKGHPGITAKKEVSTAQAAKNVAESGDASAAAICSEDAAKKYGAKRWQSAIF